MRRLSLLLSLLGLAYSATRTSPPAGSLVVSKNAGSGQYSTIQKAVDALSKTTSSAQSIFINPGTYDEQVSVEQMSGPLTIYGYTDDTSSYASNKVTITHGYSQANHGTNNDGTATLRVEMVNFKLYNVNVVNTYGKGSQALALSANNGNQGYYGCQFKGYQDTVLAERGTQLFAQTYIEGSTDFIFGQSAQAWFEQCTIGVLAAPLGYITASGRDSASSPSYYVLSNSQIAAAPGNSVSAGAYYLGRPWRSYARVAVQNTAMSAVVNAKGWAVWAASQPNTEGVEFGEFGNTGVGAQGTRASFATMLSGPLAIGSVLGSGYASQSWVDTSYL